MSATIPVVVVAGFLGAGKTTVLNHLLRAADTHRLGVIVNDFGEVGVDAMLVAGQSDSMVSLTNGCVCCTVDDGELEDTLRTLAAPDLGLDAVLVEASGLAEPAVLVRSVAGAARRTDSPFHHGGLVMVVDAATHTETAHLHPEIRRHLRPADLVVLNKIDLVTPAVRADVRRRLSAEAPGAALVETAHGRLAPGLLVDRRAPATGRGGGAREDADSGQLSLEGLWREQVGAGGAAVAADGRGGCGPDAHEHDTHDHDGCAGGHVGHRHLHDDYAQVTVEVDADLHPRRLRELCSTSFPGLYRIKGFVGLGAGAAPFLLQQVGRHLRLVHDDPRGAGEPRTQLVFIGAGLDTEAVRRAALACVVRPGEVVTELDRAELHPWIVDTEDEDYAVFACAAEEGRDGREVASPVPVGLADPEDPDCVDPTRTP